MKRNLFVFFIILLALSFSSPLYSSNGAKPIATNGVDAGRGGAGTAVGDSSHSIALNPAAIANIPGFFRLDTSASLRFGRTKYSNPNNPARFSEDRGGFVPTISFAFSIGGSTIDNHWGIKILEHKKDEKLPCGNCGKPVSLDLPQCPYCGAEFEGMKDEKLPCGNCGRMVSTKLSKCPFCGAEFEDSENVAPKPSSQSFWLIPPKLPEALPQFKVGFSLFGVLGGGGRSLMSTELFSSVESKSNIAVLAFAPTFAYRLNKYLAFGVSLHLYQVSLSDNDGIQGSGGTSNGIVKDYTQNPPATIYYFGDPLTYGELFSLAGTNDAVASSFLDVDDASGWGFGGSLGILFTPSPYITIGLSYTLEGQFGDIKGKSHLDSTKSIESINNDPDIQTIVGLLFTTLLPDGANVFNPGGLTADYDFTLKKFKTPAVLSIGIALRPFERLLFALDFRWIRWSTAFKTFKAVLTNGTNPNINAIVGSNKIESDNNFLWDDQYVIALGLEFTLLKSKNGTELALQLGYNFGNNPAPTETQSPDSAPTIEHHVTFGLRFNYGNTSLSFAYVHGLTKRVFIAKNTELPEFSNSTQEANQDVFFFTFRRDF
ncbi:MAG: hypothetical protein D6785_05620 [Planctomycetota bacterium]|nr:MAG: hypothetical protein D6785_05620 [Planctomycetota bacterium]